MRYLLPVLALFALCSLSSPAHADDPRPPAGTIGLVFAGSCIDGAICGATTTRNSLADCASAPIGDVAVAYGVKLHADASGRPSRSPVIGRLPAGTYLKVLEVRVLKADPGDAHAVWLRVAVDHYILRAEADSYRHDEATPSYARADATASEATPQSRRRSPVERFLRRRS